MANIKFNARDGISVGIPPLNSIDSSNNATFLTLSVSGNSTVSALSASSLTVSGSATFNTIPTSPSPSVDSNNSQISTTAWYHGQKANSLPLMNGVAAIGNSTRWAAMNHVHPSDTSRLTVSNPSATGSLTITGSTVTTDTPIINATQTWNGSGTSFSGIKLVINNMASADSSKPLDLIIGSNKFGVDKNCSVVQILAAPNIARDIVGISGSRHIREYQDLNDYNVTQGIGGSITNTENFEWGFTWNAKWDVGTSSYIKDRANANDHAFMFRVDKKYRNQWWFSDGTTANSPISWIKKVEFDLPNNTYNFYGNITSSSLLISGSISGNSLVLSGPITGVTTINASDVITSTVPIGTPPFVVSSTTQVANLTATNAQHLLGGNQWGLVYQSAVGVTAFTTAGTAGQVLKSSGNAAPVWVNGTISGIPLGSNLNSLTFSNAGNGAASGSLYNGSVARTISYNSIGASPLEGSTSLITVGNITTGTWNASTISIAKGGTGLTSAGTSNQLLGVTNAGGALEYKTLISSDNSIAFIHTANTIDIKLVGTIPGNVNFSGDLSVGGSSPNHKFLVLSASGNTDIKGTLSVIGKTTLSDIGASSIALNDGTSEVTLNYVSSINIASPGTTTIATIPNVYKAVEFTVKASVSSGGAYQLIKLLAVNDGAATTAITEYGNVEIGDTGVSYDVVSVGGSMTLKATTTLSNTSFTVLAQAIK